MNKSIQDKSVRLKRNKNIFKLPQLNRFKEKLVYKTYDKNNTIVHNRIKSHFSKNMLNTNRRNEPMKNEEQQEEIDLPLYENLEKYFNSGRRRFVNEDTKLKINRIIYKNYIIKSIPIFEKKISLFHNNLKSFLLKRYQDKGEAHDVKESIKNYYDLKDSLTTHQIYLSSLTSKGNKSFDSNRKAWNFQRIVEKYRNLAK